MHNIPTSSTTSINIDAKVHTDMYENDDENNDKNNQLQIIEGEAKYKKYDDSSSTNNNNTTKHKHKQSSSYSDRFEYFQKKAVEEGCPKAQHSYALLLWNGFCSYTSNSNSSDDAVESAKFHAAAAYQNHLDSIAVFGGCLRTGSGVKKNVPLGLKLIEYSASMGNPTGINKKAALLEQLNDDEVGAFHLYQTCYDSGIGVGSRSGSGRVNALLLFNLGWYYVNGLGIERKDVGKGIELWKDAADMAPDEGSEESAWYLYEHYKRDDPREAQKWFDLAFELGYPDAIEER
jgi:TPR repeat protein